MTPSARVPASDTVRVALLEADHVDEPLRGVAGDYADMFLRRFAADAPHVRLDRFDVVDGQPPPAVGAYDAVVVPGSRHGVGDGTAWITTLMDHVRDAVDADVPVVGICFGHQVVAAALGGEVARAANGWGVGVHDTTVHDTAPWMTPHAASFRLLMSHQDQVVAAPPGATVLASTHHAPIAAFQAGSAVGFQGHPEFVPDYLDALLATRVDRIGEQRVAEARASLTTPTDHELVGAWISRHLTGR